MFYKKYDKKALQDEVMKQREDGKKVYLLCFKFGELEFAVTYEPFYYSVQQHMGFHALTEGFENVTNTGYQSRFVGKKGVASFDDIKQFWLKRAKECGLDLLSCPSLLRTSGINKIGAPLEQMSLF